MTMEEDVQELAVERLFILFTFLKDDVIKIEDAAMIEESTLIRGTLWSEKPRSGNYRFHIILK